MKTNFRTKAGAATFTLLIVCGALTGCTEKDLYNPDLGKPELKPESEYFDFTTTGNVDFEVNYGKIAGGSLLEIYAKDPITFNENGTYSINGVARYKIFADENGCFNGKVELPATTDKVFIYSSSWGAPMYVEADVKNGKVTVDITEDEAETRAAETRVVKDPKVWPVTYRTNLFSVVNWDNNKYGKINKYGSNDLITTGDMESDDISSIQQSLWGGRTKPDGLDNTSKITDTKHVNTVIAKAYKNDKGETVTVKNAKIWLTFLAESAWHQNAIGYYYYPNDTAPASADKVKKYILFPNTSIRGNAPYMKDDDGKNGSYYDFGEKNAPLTKNQKIQLLYVDDKTNEVSADFPAGYTIGYFIMPKEYQTGNNNKETTYQLPNKYIYSNNSWNTDKRGNFISLSLKDKTLVYGVEDGGDKSYEDILFCIDADPNEAIQDPSRPEIDPIPPVTDPVTEITYRTYAYEDIWPSGGDYDLNDVIIEHERQITITDKNYVTKVADIFTPVQRVGAATYNDAFAVQYDSDQRGTITLPAGAIDETETSSVILFSDAKSSKDQKFTVTRTFADNTLLRKDLKTDMKADLNPFIIVQYATGKDNRTEVHLPKAKATSKADPKQNGDKDDAYYIHKDGKYPFAIMIPERTDSEGEFHFTPAKEKFSIDNNYPDFTKWAESKGTTNTDWYLNYKPLE